MASIPVLRLLAALVQSRLCELQLGARNRGLQASGEGETAKGLASEIPEEIQVQDIWGFVLGFRN